MKSFFLEILLLLSFASIIRWVNALHIVYYMNGQKRKDGAMVYNKNLVYEIFSVMVYVFLVAGIIYFAFIKKYYYLLIAFFVFFIAAINAIFHILKNIRSEIIISDESITITTGEGVVKVVQPDKIFFTEVEDNQAPWYQIRKKKDQCVDIKDTSGDGVFFNLTDNNLVDYKWHLIREFQKRYRGRAVINFDAEAEPMSALHWTILVLLLGVIWGIYFWSKQYF